MPVKWKKQQVHVSLVIFLMVLAFALAFSVPADGKAASAAPEDSATYAPAREAGNVFAAVPSLGKLHDGVAVDFGAGLETEGVADNTYVYFSVYPLDDNGGRGEQIKSAYESSHGADYSYIGTIQGGAYAAIPQNGGYYIPEVKDAGRYEAVYRIYTENGWHTCAIRFEIAANDESGESGGNDAKSVYTKIPAAADLAVAVSGRLQADALRDIAANVKDASVFNPAAGYYAHARMDVEKKEAGGSYTPAGTYYLGYYNYYYANVPGSEYTAYTLYSYPAVDAIEIPAKIGDAFRVTYSFVDSYYTSRPADHAAIMEKAAVETVEFEVTENRAGVPEDEQDIFAGLPAAADLALGNYESGLALSETAGKTPGLDGKYVWLRLEKEKSPGVWSVVFNGNIGVVSSSSPGYYHSYAGEFVLEYADVPGAYRAVYSLSFLREGKADITDFDRQYPVEFTIEAAVEEQDTIIPGAGDGTLYLDADGNLFEVALLDGMNEDVPDDEAIVFALLGDGFDRDDQKQFNVAARRLKDYLIRIAPFAEFADQIKVYRINTISKDSGISLEDITAADLPTAAGNLGIFDDAVADQWKDTYFGSHFLAWGMDRLMDFEDYTEGDRPGYYVDRDPQTDKNAQRVLAVAEDYLPAYDYTLVLANSDTYGGSGGEVAIVSAYNNSYLDMCLHEMSHSLAGLADEYWPGEAYAPSHGGRFYPNMVPATDENGRLYTEDTILWSRYIGLNGTGIYTYWENSYTQTGELPDYYRPQEWCKMTRLALDAEAADGEPYPFCEVCRDAIRDALTNALNEPTMSFQPFGDVYRANRDPVDLYSHFLLRFPDFGSGDSKDPRDIWAERIQGDDPAVRPDLEISVFDENNAPVSFRDPSRAVFTADGDYTVRAVYGNSLSAEGILTVAPGKRPEAGDKRPNNNKPERPAAGTVEIAGSGGEGLEITYTQDEDGVIHLGSGKWLSQLDDVLREQAAPGPLVVDLSGAEAATAVKLPQAALKQIASAAADGDSAANGLTIIFDQAEVTFDAAALQTIAKETKGSGMTLAVEQVEPERLSPEQRQAVGDSPVYDITLRSGAAEVHELNGTATVSVPYRLSAGEDPGGIVVYYLDAHGRLAEVTGSYDEATRRVTFTVTHLSKYVIFYDANRVWVNPYYDVAAADWYYSYVAKLSRANVVNGYPDGSYRPQGAVTYGEALKLILLAAGYEQPAARGSHWADGYLAQARAAGLLDEEVDLNAAIKRQAVAEVTARALALPAYTGDSPFADTAEAAALSLYAAGIAEGSLAADGSRLYQPERGVTRAEISAIICRILAYGK